MKSQVWIYAAAGYNVSLALFHLGFWRLFRWKEELVKLHPVNRGVMQVMNSMLIFLFLGFAGLLVAFAPDIASLPLGRAMVGGMMGFWIVRTLLQPVFFAKPATVRWGFSAIFLTGAVLHALVLQT